MPCAAPAGLILGLWQHRSAKRLAGHALIGRHSAHSAAACEGGWPSGPGSCSDAHVLPQAGPVARRPTVVLTSILKGKKEAFHVTVDAAITPMPGTDFVLLAGILQLSLTTAEMLSVQTSI